MIFLISSILFGIFGMAIVALSVAAIQRLSDVIKQYNEWAAVIFLIIAYGIYFGLLGYIGTKF